MRFHPDHPVARGVAGLALLVVLLGLAGCRGAASPGEEHDDHEEGPAHVIPEHRPKAFPAGVRQLRDYHDRIGEAIRAGKLAELGNDPDLAHALDVANWLPEVAGECDMPEDPWNEVSRHSAELVQAYGAILRLAKGARDTATDASSWWADASRDLGNLESLLEKADRSWFESGLTKR